MCTIFVCTMISNDQKQDNFALNRMFHTYIHKHLRQPLAVTYGNPIEITEGIQKSESIQNALTRTIGHIHLTTG